MPVLDPPTVRSLSIMAASQGGLVAVMGGVYLMTRGRSVPAT